MNHLPQARTEGVLLQEMDGELLIYDLNTDKALCLNETSAAVWNLCDGNTTYEEMSRRANVPPEVVWMAVEAFQKNNLLEHDVKTDLPKDGVSRRKLLTMMGTNAFALPVVGMIVAPSAAQAGSLCASPEIAPGGFLFGGANCGSTLATCQNACAAQGETTCCSGSASLTGTCPSCKCVCN
jgi:hypothetical protein